MYRSLAIQEHTTFPGLAREIFQRQKAKNYFLSRENGNMHATPSAFEWWSGSWQPILPGQLSPTLVFFRVRVWGSSSLEEVRLGAKDRGIGVGI